MAHTLRKCMEHKNLESMIPPNLAAVAAGRDYIETSEAARALNREPQTLRKNLSEKGSFHGIMPVKVGRRLLWRVSDVAALLRGGAQ